MLAHHLHVRVGVSAIFRFNIEVVLTLINVVTDFVKKGIFGTQVVNWSLSAPNNNYIG